MTRRPDRPTGAFLILMSLLLLAGSGCGSPWTVLRYEKASYNERSVTILPMDLSGVRIGSVPEVQWLASKSPKQIASWEEDKIALAAEYTSVLMANLASRGIHVEVGDAPQAGSIGVRLVVDRVRDGVYFGLGEVAGKVEARLQVSTEGRVSEESSALVKSNSGFSLGSRVRGAAQTYGYLVAEYLKRRLGV